MIGTTVSHYRVTGRLGQGGMGEVYLAEDLRLRRQVALKVFRGDGNRDQDEQARLFNEARAASALSHPNIAVIYDVEVCPTPQGPMYLLAMEYVPGRTLADLAATSSLSLDDILDVVAQTAEGLAEAHARGVVHRDIKPSNLMVANGRVKILDFGLARMQPAASPDATTWTRDVHDPAGFAGTLYYMSPEQALGQPLDARSDIFSLGVVFYELLAARRPFTGETLVQVADAILNHETPPLPIRFSDSRLPEIERLVTHMLAKRPEDRVSDLDEVAATLHRLRAGAVEIPSDGTPRLAVAGFANLTPHGEDEWLGTGLNETVTAALQGLDRLEVWGRERLRENLRKLGVETGELAADDAVQLGRMLGARWVLAGAFQRLGENVRVTARVLDVSNGRVLRALKVDGRVDGIFELQDRIVSELTAALRVTAAESYEGAETRVVGAYQALTRGLLNVRADNYESLERAILLFERALALDPNYVRAQIELGAAYEQKGEYLASADVLEKARVILRRVLDVRPQSGRAWRELGVTLLALKRVDEGMECLERALALSPDDPRVLGGMGRGYFIGRADFRSAAPIYRRAVERDPQAGWYWLQLAHCLLLMRELDEAEAAIHRAIELQEGFLSGQQGVCVVGSYMRLGHFHFLRGEYRESVDAYRRELAFLRQLEHALRSRIQIELHMRLGAALQATGDTAGADAAFDTGLEAFSARVALGADEPFTRYYAAAIHALRGEADDAVALLGQSIETIPAFARARARIEPEWDRVRNDARFARLISPPA
ncbi:MAG TPA: FlgO family outer membrane protein [Candidatus Krumholzibacteria bacterium]|nr:FlgO family outer membrane protein [Candidatus Krumholzibacteria bacterium]